MLVGIRSIDAMVKIKSGKRCFFLPPDGVLTVTSLLNYILENEKKKKKTNWFNSAGQAIVGDSFMVGGRQGEIKRSEGCEERRR